jgi:hypothetical protein
MKIKKLKSFFSLFLATGLLLTGCESNDNPQSSVYIPQPVNKKVLVEFFTNAGCFPCIAAHNFLDQITEVTGATLNDTSVVIISFHTRYPSITDSLYRANITQNDARSNYYGINFTPQGRLDGVDMGQFSPQGWADKINVEFMTTRYLNISLSNTFNPNNDSGMITASVLPVTSLPSSQNNVVHVVITESNVPYITAPNGIKYPDDVMRLMVTGQDGEAISLSQGQTTVVSKSYVLPSYIKNEDECYIVVFIQNSPGKQVYGVERIKVK